MGRWLCCIVVRASTIRVDVFTQALTLIALRRTGCLPMPEMLHIDQFGQRLDPLAESYPAWTIRCTWRVTDASDQPVFTYHSADDECSALDRAVYVLDHYGPETSDELVCVDVMQPGGWWSQVPSSST